MDQDCYVVADTLTFNQHIDNYLNKNIQEFYLHYTNLSQDVTTHRAGVFDSDPTTYSMFFPPQW